MKAKRETEFLMPEEIEAVLRTPDKRTLQGRRDYALLLTLFTTGMRKAEICGCKVKNLMTYRNQPMIEVLGKGKKTRRIPLKIEVLQAIKDYWKFEANIKDSESAMFYTLGKHGPYQSRPLTSAAVDKLIHAVAKKALIKKRFHPHVCRHTFATSLLDNGVDLKTVQSLLGHENIKTSEAYLHTNIDKKFSAVNSLQFG